MNTDAPPDWISPAANSQPPAQTDLTSAGEDGHLATDTNEVVVQQTELRPARRRRTKRNDTERRGSCDADRTGASPAYDDQSKYRQLHVRLPLSEYNWISAIACQADQTPQTFLRLFVKKAYDTAAVVQRGLDVRAMNGDSQSIPEHLSESITRIEFRLASIEAVIARIGNATADSPAPLRQIDALTRATLFQAVAASYLGIEIWRALAPASKLPEHALPPEMLADIQKATRRITAEAERDARS